MATVELPRLDTLPEEVLSRILSFLPDARDLACMRCVSRLFRDLIDDPSERLWSFLERQTVRRLKDFYTLGDQRILANVNSPRGRSQFLARRGDLWKEGQPNISVVRPKTATADPLRASVFRASPVPPTSSWTCANCGAFHEEKALTCHSCTTRAPPLVHKTSGTVVATLVSSLINSYVQVLDLDTMELGPRLLAPPDADPFRLSISYPFVAIGDTNGSVSLYDIQTGRLLDVALDGDHQLVWMVYFHPNNDRLFVLHGDRLIDVYTLKPTGELSERSRRVYWTAHEDTCSRINVARERAVTVGFDGRVRLWSASPTLAPPALLAEFVRPGFGLCGLWRFCDLVITVEVGDQGSGRLIMLQLPTLEVVRFFDVQREQHARTRNRMASKEAEIGASLDPLAPQSDLQAPLEWDGDFDFVVLADPQLGLLHRNESWTEELDMLKQSVDYINKLKPRFVIVLGDLVHCPPSPCGDSEKHARQVKDLKDALAAVDAAIPVAYVSGNHDIGDTVTSDTLRIYRDDFGPDYYRFTVAGLAGIVVNTQLWKDPGEVQDEASAQNDWFHRVLQQSSEATHRMIFGHIPPFIFTPDEDTGYFNLARSVREPLLSAAKNAGVSAWFAGHYHREAGGRDEQLEVITSSASGAALEDTGKNPLGIESCGQAHVGTAFSGLRVVHVTKTGYSHAFHLLKDLN
ncbi:uncharacterized protein MONBRDRAFT_37443 [Monosiga brevicollis MX1]|uniref:Serine/threonine-protein phosphatase CPPED1 n=1 Tax=Monosiga brevicollis TaxID=81824 RepID=A9V1S5_MONBE|nr:uncharacterized protein MONBRDRAFT_37443 [Monosiga brevicollis MX1]EDQ88614.1 predicted protein [Monosiga brevicollis MX1]|eukprot:XP_001746718.1 hypothetical protein [Monosiga brevicollis MX1]